MHPSQSQQFFSYVCKPYKMVYVNHCFQWLVWWTCIMLKWCTCTISYLVSPGVIFITLCAAILTLLSCGDKDHVILPFFVHFNVSFSTWKKFFFILRWCIMLWAVFFTIFIFRYLIFFYIIVYLFLQDIWTNQICNFLHWNVHLCTYLKWGNCYLQHTWSISFFLSLFLTLFFVCVYVFAI